MHETPTPAGCLGRLLPLIVAATTVSPVLAQEPSADQGDIGIRVARLIDRLGADSFSERSDATAELARLGTDARGQLELAAGHADPEVRLRAKELLRRLKVADVWSGGKARFARAQASSSEILRSLADQTGNRLLLGDQYGGFHDQPVELAEPHGSFWPIVDEVCRQSGNRVRPHYDSRNPGLVVVAGNAGKFPVTYAGPLRAQITSARRAFSEELDYEELRSDVSHTFQLNMQLMWEDRFRLVAYRSQPELVLARTDSGVELSATQPSAAGWNVAGAGTRQLTMNLRLHPPPTAASRLDNLTLKWGLIAVGDMAELVVDALDHADSYFQDDVELVVHSVESGPGPRCEVSLEVIRELIVPEPQEVIFQEIDVELHDHADRPFRKQGQSNSLTDHGAKLKLTFLGESAESVPGRLKVTYPRIRTQRDVEIVFRHVPLPVASPQ